MPHLIANTVEKSFTPFTAKLAPRHLWNRPVLGKYSNLTLIALDLQPESPRK